MWCSRILWMLLLLLFFLQHQSVFASSLIAFSFLASSIIIKFISRTYCSASIIRVTVNFPQKFLLDRKWNQLFLFKVEIVLQAFEINASPHEKFLTGLLMCRKKFQRLIIMLILKWDHFSAIRHFQLFKTYQKYAKIA